MELVKDFVSKRGGGFHDAGWELFLFLRQLQQYEQILPVWLHQGDAASTMPRELGIFRRLSMDPPSGLEPSRNREDSVWSTMPPLTDWNLVRDLKPGKVLATLNPAGKEVRLWRSTDSDAGRPWLFSAAAVGARGTTGLWSDFSGDRFCAGW